MNDGVIVAAALILIALGIALAPAFPEWADPSFLIYVAMAFIFILICIAGSKGGK